ncbi:MAG: hypothetical protein EXS59_01915 [Candidatus Taylorbacteria bacterium]|nr:hypothetical protein [Candidatus Taylorbacteria bacterium]
MKKWVQIIVVAFVLVGGTASFGYWSMDQFDRTLDNLSAVYFSIIPPVDSFFKSRKITELASSSPEISGLSATSTATSTDIKLASSSPETFGSSSTPVATSTVTKLAFTFPQNEGGIYTGCMYPISWQSPETINSFEAVLADAGTRETVGQKTGGLAKENIVEKDSQILNWKVGAVWSGSYYIKISKINGAGEAIRSKIFSIKKMSAGISADESEKICEGSGGSF